MKAPGQSEVQYLDLFSADRMHTFENEYSGNSILVSGGRILHVGSELECDEYAQRLLPGAKVRRHHFEGVMVPGFVDPHTHPLIAGQLNSWVDCSPRKVSSVGDIIAALKHAKDALPEGAPVRGFGLVRAELAEGREPTRWELDEVSSDQEVIVLIASGHGGVVNSYTLEKYMIGKTTPDPEGGAFFRDNEGELTGELSDTALEAVVGLDGVRVGLHGPNPHFSDTPAHLSQHFDAAQDMYLSYGVTTVGDTQVTKREFSTYHSAQQAGELRIRVINYFLSHALESIDEIGLRGAFGNSQLVIGGVKLYADGSLGSRTAYFKEGYANDPCRTGVLYHQDGEFARLLEHAHRLGLQTGTHAQSPDAIDLVLDAIEAAQNDSPRPDARHRIEHCGLPTPEAVERMKTLGVIAVAQPIHYEEFADGFVQASLGERAENYNPFGWFRDSGVSFAFSSDAPIAVPHPLRAIQVAITRQTRHGNRYGDVNQPLSIEDAFRAHLLGAAYALRLEHQIGSIAPGKFADFAILDEDPLTTEVENLARIRVLATVVNGEERWRLSS